MRLLFSAILLFGHLASLTSQVQPLTPSAGDRSIAASVLSPGDILFASTNDTKSYLIRKFTGGGPASHVAIISDAFGGNYFVVEALSGGVRKTALPDFLAANSTVVAFRYPSLDQARTGNIIAYLNGRIGAPYDYWGAFTSSLFKLNGADVTVDYGQFTTQKTYCSKLVIEAYQQANIDLCRLTSGWTSPNDLATMTWFNQLTYVGHLEYTP